MDRVPLAARRRRLRLLTLLAAVPMLAVAPAAYAAIAFGAQAAPEGPTIAFTTTGTVPLVCGTRPSVTSMQVRTGTRIIIANLTDVAARAVVADKVVADLGPGAGALIRLRRGQHEIHLVPECVVVTETEAAAVSVLTAREMRNLPSSAPPDPRGSDGPDEQQNGPDEQQNGSYEQQDGPVNSAVQPTVRAGATDPDPGTGATGTPAAATTTSAGSAQATATPSDGPVNIAVQPTVDAGATDPDPGTGATDAPEAATTTSAGSARASATPSDGPVAVAASAYSDPDDPVLDGLGESAVIEVRPITLGDPENPKAGRLLAVIAAICVFGVTAAIIRAIVSQRTSSAVPP